MAIHIYCTGCYTSNGLDAKSCSNCGAVFGRDKKYRVCVSVKGNRATRVVANLTLARQKEATLQADLERGEMDIKKKKKKKAPTLNEVWAKFLPWAKEHKKTWITDDWNYKKHLEPRFGKKRLDAIAQIDVDRMKLDLKKSLNKNGKPYAPATIKHLLVLMKRLYSLARQWGLYSGENPMDRVAVPKLDNQVTEFLKDDEAARLLQTLDSWPCKVSAAFVKFTLFTGVRRGEVFKLTWADVDFDRGMVTLKQPKGGKTKTIPISSQALEVLRGLPHTTDYVFPGKKGGQRTDFKGPWLRIREAAGLPKGFRFHGLRHHFASTLVSNGVDLCIVQELLTHKDSRTTQRYAHLSPGALMKAALNSGELLTPKMAKSKVINLTED